MQPTNYLVTYLQGMFAEYLALQISKDANFTNPIVDRNTRELNRYTHSDIIRISTGGYKTSGNIFHQSSAIGYTNDTPPYYKTFTPAELKAIERLTGNRNAITLTHFYWPNQTHLLNLPRMRKVFYYTEPENVPFVFIMGILKAWIVRRYDHPYHAFQQATPYGRRGVIKAISEIENFRPTLLDEHLFSTGFRDDQIGLFLKQTYSYYYQRAIIGSSKSYKLDGWEYLDSFALVNDPKSNVETWKTIFNMAAPLDPLELFLYQQKNKQLIKNQLGMTYEELMQEDWMLILEKYLEKHSFFFNYEDKVLR